MKTKYIIITLFMVSALSLRAQNNFIEKYSKMKGVTVVNISKTLLQLMPDMDANGMNIGDIAQDLDSMYILTSEDGATSNKMKADYIAMIREKGYEELMSVKDKNEHVKFFIKKNKNKISELVMAVDNSPKFVYITLCGNLSLEKINKLTNT